jgi:multiple sugar transport system substrate-binding protein
MKQRFLLLLAILLTMLFSLTGCFDSGGGILNIAKSDKYDPDTPVTLKILKLGPVSKDSRDLVNDWNADLAAKQFPKMTLQFIDSLEISMQVSSQEQFWERVEQEQPDIYIIGSDWFADRAANQKLLDLTPLIERDEFELNAFHSNVIEQLRSIGDGVLYGLSPRLDGQALYYNKALFDEFGVDYPVEEMSWEQLFERAARFAPNRTKDRPLVGFLLSDYIMNPFELVRQIAFAKGQIPVNAAVTEVDIRSDEWRQAFELVMNGMQGGYVTRPAEEREVVAITSEEERYALDPFISGFAAMRIEGSEYRKDLHAAERLGVNEADWRLAPIPIEPQYPDATQGFSLGDIFAIAKESPNANAAWEWIKFFHSETIAERIVEEWGIPSRLSYIQDNKGDDVGAFVKYGGDPRLSIYEHVAKTPRTFLNVFYNEIAKEEMNRLLDGLQTLDETIAQIEERGQSAFDEAKKAEEGQ